ncbi:MAG TPA: polysaccharide biosynthesis/export family protein [Bryobacteraceae bacterium]|jgi:polysaccharide export outer membrane protein
MNPTILSLFAVLTLLVEAPPPATMPDTYTLGPGDQIMIRVLDFEEIDNKAVPIDLKGSVNLPEVGRIQASGLTTEQLEGVIAERLKRYLVKPDVSVYLTEMRSQPVSVLGQVQSPGVHQLQGQKNLFEVLSLAGGLRQEAGNVINITRRLEWGPIPLPGAAKDSTGEFSVASVDVKSVMNASNPAENILIKPNDVISVPKADTIYVIGAVHKPGAYVLGEYRTLSALQILALAEGPEKTADTRDSRIMRVIPGSNDRAEIPVDLRTILSGKMPDIPLTADDILFVPVSKAKAVGYRTLDALVQVGTMAVYRVP